MQLGSVLEVATAHRVAHSGGTRTARAPASWSRRCVPSSEAAPLCFLNKRRTQTRSLRLRSWFGGERWEPVSVFSMVFFTAARVYHFRALCSRKRLFPEALLVAPVQTRQAGAVCARRPEHVGHSVAM